MIITKYLQLIPCLIFICPKELETRKYGYVPLIILDTDATLRVLYISESRKISITIAINLKILVLDDNNPLTYDQLKILKIHSTDLSWVALVQQYNP